MVAVMRKLLVMLNAMVRDGATGSRRQRRRQAAPAIGVRLAGRQFRGPAGAADRHGLIVPAQAVR